MASDPQSKNRMQVFKNKGKDQDVRNNCSDSRIVHALNVLLLYHSALDRAMYVVIAR